MSKRFGYDLNDAFFFVKSSMVSNVAQFGSTLSSASISIYASNTMYHIGVDSSVRPLLWMGNEQKKILWMNIDTSRVGIGTSEPRYSLDVEGDLRVSGKLIHKGSNVTLLTGDIECTSIKPLAVALSPDIDAIDFTNTPITNVGTARFASNVYVGATLYTSNINVWGVVETVNQTIYNSERIVVSNKDDGPAIEVRQYGAFPVATFLADGGAKTALSINAFGGVGIGTSSSTNLAALLVDGVTIQQMGNIQRISACVGQVPIYTTGIHQMGFVFSWENDALTEKEMIEADVTFYGSGHQTRTYLHFGQFINPLNNGTTLPGGDIMTDYKLLKYKAFPNIRYVKNTVTRAGDRAVQIRITWRSDVATNYNVNFKIDMMVPKRLGYSGMTSFYSQLIS
jgi:hypothetical protein